MTETEFGGFSPAALNFLDELNANNNRDWFAANKSTYENEIKKPAAACALALEDALTNLIGVKHIAKIYRVNRDIRFSKDKTPYNAHVHISFAPEGSPASLPMWFFGLGTEKLSLGCGVFAFEKADLVAFRDRVAGTEGAGIEKMIDTLKADGVRISDPDLKQVPRGYPKDHARADLLRHKGLAAWLDFEDRDWILGSDMASGCARQFERLLPMFMTLMMD